MNVSRRGTNPVIRELAFPVGENVIIDPSILDSASPMPRHGGSLRRRIFVKWTDERTATLANEVRSYPFLHDFNHPNHKDKELRNRTWAAVAKAVGIVSSQNLIDEFGRECERRFKNLRDELIKSSKRMNTKPYKHAEILNYIDVSQRGGLEDQQFYDGSHQAADHDYDYVDDGMEVEAHQAAYSAGNSGVVHDGQVYATDNNRFVNRTAFKPKSVKRALTTSVSSSSRSFHPYYSRTLDVRHNEFTPTVRSIKREPAMDMDELDDFGNMLMKRIRRIPEDAWGQVMSRLMETLSNVEESVRKPSLNTAGSQTDE